VSARGVLGAGGLLSEALPGFVPREAQIAMSELVENVLGHGGTALIEAGTGTGKTFAYLVPAILSHRRVIVSTGTRTLQDQLLNKDVPLLERAFGRSLDVAVLKGLPNYLCRRRLSDASYSASSVSDRALASALPRIHAWAESTASGDHADLSGLREDHPAWEAVRSGSETRIGPRCRFHAECFVTLARKRASEAQIVVVNHHLYFADLALRAEGRRSGVDVGVLPPHDAVIFDEAHQLEDVLTQFFGVHLTLGRLDTLARDAERALVHAGVGADIGRLAASMLNRAEALFDRLPRTEGGDARVSLETALASGELLERLFDLDAALEAIAEHAHLHREAGEGVAQIARRAERARGDVGVLVDPARTLVGWAEGRGGRAAIGASPVDVASVFRDEVIRPTRAVVLTSATLGTDGSFGFLRARLGIEGEIDEAIFPSPFDWEQVARLYLPLLSDPREAGHFDESIREIDALLTASRGGAFVLSTSIRNMNALHRALAVRLAAAGRLVLKQGDLPKGELLDRFRARHDAVLFATQSFWEGVDVPGLALRLVVIDRLPFDVPTDPLIAARSRKLEEEGRAPFMEYLVPAAALALKQGFGRLLRTQDDRGVVAVLDARIRTKGYGKVFLRALPPAPVEHEREPVLAFLRAIELPPLSAPNDSAPNEAAVEAEGNR
jgi:ATP-dependent DNA helicase DinG